MIDNMSRPYGTLLDVSLLISRAQKYHTSSVGSDRGHGLAVRNQPVLDLCQHLAPQEVQMQDAESDSPILQLP